jgi:leishmanolysin
MMLLQANRRRHASVILVFVVILAAMQRDVRGRAIEHECIHDTEEMQAEQARLLAAGPATQSYRSAQTEGGDRLFHAQTAQHLRIVLSFEDLSTPGKYCAGVNNPTLVPSFRSSGGMIMCTGQEDVVTPEKRRILQTKLLPAAAARLSQYLRVEPIRGYLRVPSVGSCGAATIPPSHVRPGIPDADLVVYVTAVPTTGSTVAFATACSKDQYGRTIIGRVNIRPMYVTWSETDEKVNEALIDVATHELVHVLGLSTIELSRPGWSMTRMKRGKWVTLVSTPSVVAFVRNYTGCPTLEGAEVEDEGDVGSVGSHWERKLYRDELMCAVTGYKFSGLTLAFLNDINVGYTVDLAAAEQMWWGRNTGCGVHDFTCNTTEGGRGKYYCFDNPATFSKNKCTADLRAIGTCATQRSSELRPVKFRYFPDPRDGGPKYMDGCANVEPYEEMLCSSAVTPSATDSQLGQRFGASSRCYETEGVSRAWYSTPAIDGPRCFETRCADDGTVEFRLSSDAPFVRCPREGDILPAPQGFFGQITCPNAADMCATLVSDD